MMTRDKWRQLCKDTAEYIKTPLFIHISTTENIHGAVTLVPRRWSRRFRLARTGFAYRLTPEQRQAKLDRTSSSKRRIAREAAKVG